MAAPWFWDGHCWTRVDSSNALIAQVWARRGGVSWRVLADHEVIARGFVPLRSPVQLAVDDWEWRSRDPLLCTQRHAAAYAMNAWSAWRDRQGRTAQSGHARAGEPFSRSRWSVLDCASS